MPLYKSSAGPWHYVGAVGEPAFSAGWQNYGGGYQVARFRLAGDIVTVQGLVQRASGALVVPFVLPVGFRPPLSHVTAHIATDQLCRLDYQSGGSIVVQSAPGGFAFVDINGSFTIT